MKCVRNGAPESLHVDGSLENKEDMSIVVGVERFAVRAKVFGAEGTAVPFSDDTQHVPVAKRKAMREVTKKGYNDPMSTMGVKVGKGYIPAGSPDISAAGLPGTGPAGSRYLEGEKKCQPHLYSTTQFISINFPRTGLG